MAITRTAPYGVLTDDSGSGTDGTPWNNAWLQGMLNLIDARWSLITNSTTGTQNNVSITSGGVEADIFVWTGGADTTITGFQAPSSPAKPWKPLVVINGTTSFNIFLSNQTGSSAGNQLFNIATSAPTPVAPRGFCVYRYAPSSGTWRLCEHEQGSWITPSFSAGTYTSTGTWTVEAVDRATQAYRLVGKTLTVAWWIGNTSITTGTSTQLSIGNGAYGGFTSAKLVITTGMANNNALGLEPVYMQVNASGTSILILQLDGGTWSASTNNTSVYGEITFEVT